MTTSVFLSPVFGAGVQILSNSGVPLGGGKITIYLAGTTTLTNTYTTPQADVLNPNPIILDSSGRCPTMIWLPAGLSYKFAITDTSGNPVGYTLDGVAGINDATFPYATVSEWNLGAAPTYISATSFSVNGDQTGVFAKYRRVKTTNTAGIIYSTVVSSSYGSGITTVVVSNDSTPLDAGLVSVYYAIINSSPISLPGNVAMLGIGVSGTGNLALGSGAAPTVTGNYNIAIGNSALHAAVGATSNIAIGDHALSLLTTLSSNVAIGTNSQPSTLTGANNVSIGTASLGANSSGGDNVAVGVNSTLSNVGGSSNVGVGRDALLLYLGGSYNVALGAGAGAGAGTGAGAPYNGGSHNIYIGYNSFPLTTTDTNTIVIGDTITSKGSNTTLIGNSSMTDVFFGNGRINIPQYSTAGAPAYVKGALYFDTTLNKLRVGGATAWETITSV